MSRIGDLIGDGRPHLFDGGMGTMLYAGGVFINRCYDELNLTDPKLVADVHGAYIRAGAEIVETNTFGANRIKLAQHGLEERVGEINASAARIARRAAGDHVAVAGSIGPLGIRIEPYGPTSADDAREIFREQAEGLLEGGVDGFVLETFSFLEEIRQALAAVRELTDLPVFAQMAIGDDGATAYGTSPEVCAARLSEWGAEVVGLNCSVGPHGLLQGVERMAPATTTPLSAQPNAGMPREVHGRQMYMASPEYFAKYARRLMDSGARFVGGCCGTTPEHIRRMADAVRMRAPRVVVVPSGGAALEGPEEREPVPLARRSVLGRKIAAGEFYTTVEIVPPKGIHPEAMLAGVAKLRDAGIDGINVPDGPRAQMRMSALATSALIAREGGIEPVVHYSCRDRNLLGMLSDLLGAHALGVRNLLIVTGDPPKMGPYPDATAVFDIDSIGLTNLVTRLNRGLDPGGNAIGDPTGFAIGVGANPSAVDADYELERFYWKVDAGAEYCITQPVFDPEQLLDFVARTEERGIRIPVIAGIWPLVSARNAEFLANEVPGISVPAAVMERMRAASERGKEAAIDEGVAIARESLSAVRSVLQGVQVSAPFGRVEVALRVLEE
ncbi:MAG TPA: bifunctional homocysteine S-methyltransferase/methylenetetrahydrofolate reductase [Longimicrobiales bacterium]|nr:bifunctional homocysteine S-methyltransferase/methylenetetrahydrofolate reductase [Longimicrobiales bacterium]